MEKTATVTVNVKTIVLNIEARLVEEGDIFLDVRNDCIEPHTVTDAHFDKHPDENSPRAVYIDVDDQQGSFIRDPYDEITIVRTVTFTRP